MLLKTTQNCDRISEIFRYFDYTKLKSQLANIITLFNLSLGIIAILFFNMTMPITLTALSNILFYNKGMAFGLLTFALFIGAIPVFFGFTQVIFTPVALFITTMVSMIVLYIGIKKYRECMEKK